MSSSTEFQEVQVHASEKIDHQTVTEDGPSDSGRRSQKPGKVMKDYLLNESPEFKRLCELRKKGWENSEGDRFFEKQRQTADLTDNKTAKLFYRMMKDIGHDMARLTGGFGIKSPFADERCILDMCMAPGGFLATALRLNPGARALGFSLPKSEGGHKVLLPRHPNVTLKFLDVTMLAADMGLSSIPCEHPDAVNFLPGQFSPGQLFDLVLCDGQVLRGHNRAAYREHKEASRLTVTQLVLGLDHLKPGGTMIVLLHKVEALNTVQLLYTFDKFASVQLFKPTRIHAKRSSFYMIATNIKANCREATIATERWKSIWKAATFGTDDMYCKALYEDGPDEDVILKEFGPKLVGLGKKVWDIQANALANAPFLKESTSS